VGGRHPSLELLVGKPPFEGCLPSASAAHLQSHERICPIFDNAPQIDVWAAGILAFELLVGKPPFEVDDEAHTVNMILTCNKIPFPTRHSPRWGYLVGPGIYKRPHARPTATQLLEHPCGCFLLDFLIFFAPAFKHKGMLRTCTPRRRSCWSTPVSHADSIPHRLAVLVEENMFCACHVLLCQTISLGHSWRIVLPRTRDIQTGCSMLPTHACWWTATLLEQLEQTLSEDPMNKVLLSCDSL